MKHLISLFLFIISLFLFGQENEVHVNARINKTEITVGDEVVLNISIATKNTRNIRFPILSDTITNDLEIITVGKIDTIKATDKSLFLSQNISFSAYDSGYKIIPPIAFDEIISSDSILRHYTNSLTLYVNILPVDTTQAIKDVKPPLDVKISWTEYLNTILIILGVILFLIFLWYAYKIFVKKEKIKIFTKPKEPPYIIAIRDLEKLRNSKLWQNNLYKEYYSQLTDIFRVYLVGTFNINAPEMTTEDIIDSLDKHNDNNIKESTFEITLLLKLSDKVKFAKEIPLPDECDKSFKSVYEFVLKTKPQELNNSKENGNN
ncbi:MAG: hypothetical protein A2X02_09020 [Bacteroidetes bacterium GWF2_29_10]|nr:MAG: hypothetical protein A2X02_09020 [Bacteroidetes bacterium GWF2_29_10]